MTINNEYIKLIFGLKIKQIRTERQFSLSELALKSGLSASYINEIEKGKKYPKTDKIAALSNALDVQYDELISLQLNKKLEPISDLLKSNFLTEIPFDFFGIEPSNLLEMLANAPTKLSAFIKTIIKVAKSYSVSVEKFYFSMLRSYQEMHYNYFPELEKHVDNFRANNHMKGKNYEPFLRTLLNETYGIEIATFNPLDYPLLSKIRSIYNPKSKKLQLNSLMTADQRCFTLAREIGFAYMGLKIRPLTSSWIKVNSFDEVFNNFQASYFAGALLINKDPLIKKVKDFFESKTFSGNNIIEMITHFKTTPETLFQRVFSLLPEYFGINRIFFMKFESEINSNTYQLTKELHLYKLHDPQENQNLNYCRRWLSLNILDELSSNQLKGNNNPILEAQISDYLDVGNQYLIISLAKNNSSNANINDSISIGFELNDTVKSKIKFLDDKSIRRRTVNQTCEKCSLFDCKERVAAPTKLQEKRHYLAMVEAIENMD